MMAAELIPTCAECHADLDPGNSDDIGPCVHALMCRSCWERCDRAACRDGCHESGGAA